MEKLSIVETKELLAFGFDLQESIFRSLADDGKITLGDAPRFLAVALSAAKGIGGINRVGAEMLDLDAEEKAELVEFARQRFDLTDDVLEVLIEDTLGEVLDLYRLSIRWTARKKAA